MPSVSPQNKLNTDYLTDGQIYTVDFVWVSQSFSSVYLKEFPGVPFNSTYFDNLNMQDRRDGLFEEEYNQVPEFKNYIRSVCPNNCRLKMGLSAKALTKEQVFSYFKEVPFNIDYIKLIGRKSSEVDDLMKKFGYRQMYRIQLISTYHNLVCFYFWNGPNQFIEFYLDN